MKKGALLRTVSRRTIPERGIIAVVAEADRYQGALLELGR